MLSHYLRDADGTRQDMLLQAESFKQELDKIATIYDIKLYSKVYNWPGVFGQLLVGVEGYMYLSVGSAQFDLS